MRTSGIRLLKKGKQGIVRALLFSRIGLFVALLAIQLLIIVGVFYLFVEPPMHFFGLDLIISVIMVLYLINSRMDSTAKVTWMVVIMIATIPGTLLYLFTQSDLGHRTLKKRIEDLILESKDKLPQNKAAWQALRSQDKAVASLACYMNNNSCHPVYRNTAVEYFPS